MESVTSKHVFPLDVENFFLDFRLALYDRNINTIKRIYESDFNHLTDLYYSNIRWPSDVAIEQFYTEKNIYNPIVISLYRELYYRHLLARCSSEIAWYDRYLSSRNYHILLEYIATEECKPQNNLTLPPQWQWDILDEFVYQFQEAQRWKAQYAKEVASYPIGLTAMSNGSDAWKSSDVILILSNIIEASSVKTYLEQLKSKGKTDGLSSKNQIMDQEQPILWGYFAMISLMKLYVSIGDYHSALEAVNLLEMSPHALYWKIPACHITLIYNLGFCYLMMRRYYDALRVLNQIITFVNRSRNYLSSQSYQQEVMIRMIDKMYHLVMLCNALSPGRLDSTIETHIQERWADKYFKLQSDEIETYKEVFSKACPKFFSPFISDYSDIEELQSIDQHEPFNRQLKIFLKDVSHQNRVMNVRCITKLYNNLTLDKLASLRGIRAENRIEIIRSELLSVRNRVKQVVWVSGPLLSGELTRISTDLDIYLDKDTIYIMNSVSNKNYTDLFIKQIQKTLEAKQSFLINNKSDYYKSLPQST